jgi:hypothetical protein
MPEEKHQNIIELINSSINLAPNEKEFLISKLDEIKALDRLKVQKDLQAGLRPELLESLLILRNQFIKKEAPPKPDLFSKIAQAINPPKPKKILSSTVINNTTYLGSNPPNPVQAQQINLPSIEQFSDLSQLNSLVPSLVTFEINDNSEQKLLQYFQKLDDLFLNAHDINQKRSYFMNYLQSPLYLAYMDTGLTALRHPEITPSNIILNRLQQIDPKYLNTKQFQTAAKITGHIRSLVSI